VRRRSDFLELNDRTRPSIRVSRRFAAFAYDLTTSNDDAAIQENYRLLRPFDKAVGYALFALGNPETRSPSTVEVRDILETLAVERGTSGRFNGNHYRALFSSLRLLRYCRVVLPGDPVAPSTILSDLRVHYRDGRSGYFRSADTTLTAGAVANISMHRPAFGRNARVVEVSGSEHEILGEIFTARGAEKATAVPVAAYSFVFSRPIRDDVTLQPGAKGFVTIFNGPQFFRVLASLRKARIHTAFTLLELIGSDIISLKTGNEVLRKRADFIYRILGFPPGRRRSAVERVSRAVRLLVEHGVLEEYSDLYPRDSGRGAVYTWVRSPIWRFRN